jgi:UDP-glucose 4-epimerase
MQGVALAAHGFLPVAFDDLSRGHADFVRWGPLVQGDILDLAALNAGLRATSPRRRHPFGRSSYKAVVGLPRTAKGRF